MLQDLIQAAMNDALEKIRSSQMQQLAGLGGRAEHTRADVVDGDAAGG